MYHKSLLLRKNKIFPYFQNKMKKQTINDDDNNNKAPSP